MGRKSLVGWLIISELVFLASLLWWYVGFIFASEIGSLFFAFVGSYPFFVLASIVMSWLLFRKRAYRGSFWWSLFPTVWYVILTFLIWLE